MKIGIIGHVCQDHNQVENSKYVSAGSPAMFMNKIFKQLEGIDVTIISHYGSDYLKYLNGINIYPVKPNFTQTLIYKNIVKVNARRKQFALNRECSPMVELDNGLSNILKNLDVCIMAPLLPNFDPETMRKLLKNLSTSCLKVLLPQGYFRDFKKDNSVIFREFNESEIVRYFDFVILSDEDYPDITNISKSWVNNANTTVIITKGPEGAFYRSHNKGGIVPTIKVDEIVDSTGSGDIFSAAFTYAFVCSQDIVNSIHFANRVAGYCLMFTPDMIDITKAVESNSVFLKSTKIKIPFLSPVINLNNY